MTRGFKKLNENATIPERATEHSAGYQMQGMTFQQVKQLRFNLMKLKW